MNYLHPLRNLLSTLLLGGLLLTGAAAAAAQEQAPAASPAHRDVVIPQPFHAVYIAKYSGTSVKATRTLEVLEDGTMELRFVAKSWLATIREVSQFSWNPAGQLIPQHYFYQRTGLGYDRTAKLKFDWNTKRVENNVQDRPWTMTLPDGTLDKLSYQLQLSADMLNHQHKVSYQVADGGRLKTYDFEVQGQEVLDTPMGKLNTTRIKRIRDDNERVTVLWLATDWNHLLVKIWQQEENGKHYEINLASAKLNGETVTGL